MKALGALRRRSRKADGDVDSMRAVFFDRYGPPEVLYEGTAPMPRPGRGEVLVRVHALSVNGGELLGRSGRMQLVTGRRFPQRTGLDFTGEVAALGSAAGGVAQGERVWGILPRDRLGSAADYVAVSAQRIGRVPEGLAAVEAASLPVATTTITALRDKARLRPGERLLVRGASGGVGSVTVQLGAALGARVTGLAAPRNLDFVRGLGAEEVFSYADTRPQDLGRFDVIVDTAGPGQPAYRRLLAPGGRMVAVAFDTRRMLAGVSYILASSLYGPRRVRFFSGNPGRALFVDLARYVEEGAIAPVVDTVRPLAETAAAHRALEVGGVRGKHIVQVV